LRNFSYSLQATEQSEQTSLLFLGDEMLASSEGRRENRVAAPQTFGETWLIVEDNLLNLIGPSEAIDTSRKVLVRSNVLRIRACPSIALTQSVDWMSVRLFSVQPSFGPLEL
jgi:hypothetical protein